MDSIRTERLRLRPLTRDEAERIVAADRSGRNWSPGYPREDDRDIARMVMQQPDPADPWFGPLQIVRRDTGDVIGGIGFFGLPDAEGTAGVGYGVAPEVQGQGFATEALHVLLSYGFGTVTVRRVVADTTHDNVGSQRVMEKCGMRRIASDDRLRYYEIHRH